MSDKENYNFNVEMIHGWKTIVLETNTGYTMSYAGEGGAIVSGSTYIEAMAKYKEGMDAYRIFKGILAIMTDEQRENFDKKTNEPLPN